MITTVMALTALAIDLMMPTFADVRATYGMNPDSSEVGWIITVFFLGLSVGPWLFGPASDRHGRRTPLLVGLVLYALCAVASAFAPTFATMVLIRFIWGIVASGPRAIAMAIIRDRYSGEAMARLMSMILSVFMFVPILAPSLGAAINAVLPWQFVFATPAVLAVILLLWTRRLPETLAAERRQTMDRNGLRLAMRAAANRETMLYTFGVMFLFGVMTSYLAGFEVVLHDAYDATDAFPVLFGLLGIAMAIGIYLSGRFVGRYGLTRWMRRLAGATIATAALFVGVSMIGDGVPSLAILVVVLAFVLPVVQGLLPTGNAAAMLPVPEVAGTASALISTATMAGGAILGSIVTALYDGTVRPLAVSILVFVTLAAALIVKATRLSDRRAATASTPA